MDCKQTGWMLGSWSWMDNDTSFKKKKKPNPNNPHIQLKFRRSTFSRIEKANHVSVSLLLPRNGWVGSSIRSSSMKQQIGIPQFKPSVFRIQVQSRWHCQEGFSLFSKKLTQISHQFDCAVASMVCTFTINNFLWESPESEKNEKPACCYYMCQAALNYGFSSFFPPSVDGDGDGPEMFKWRFRHRGNLVIKRASGALYNMKWFTDDFERLQVTVKVKVKDILLVSKKTNKQGIYFPSFDRNHFL